MAKGAAKEKQLGSLHTTLARVFEKVLLKYEMDLKVIEKFGGTDEDGELVADDLMVAMLAELGEPNPAMLSAIAKFLKDNDIGMDSEAVEELNSTQRRLEERRAARKAAGLNLSVVPHVEAS